MTKTFVLLCKDTPPQHCLGFRLFSVYKFYVHTYISVYTDTFAHKSIFFYLRSQGTINIQYDVKVTFGKWKRRKTHFWTLSTLLLCFLPCATPPFNKTGQGWRKGKEARRTHAGWLLLFLSLRPSSPPPPKFIGPVPKILIHGDGILSPVWLWGEIVSGHDGTLAQGVEGSGCLEHPVGRTRLSNLEVRFRARQRKECEAAFGQVWSHFVWNSKLPSTGSAPYLNQQKVYWFSLCQHKLTSVPDKRKRVLRKPGAGYLHPGQLGGVSQVIMAHRSCFH